jgi:uncharacterized protein YjbI with pentapeptide repeats
MVPVGPKKPRREVDQPPEPRTVWPRWTGLRGKTLWDWLLLISALAVPVVVGFAGLWFTQQQAARQQDIEDQRSQDTAMQAYLDSMSTLLIDEQGTQLRKLDPDEEVLDLIQARTETVFAVLNRERQVSIVLFLARAQLILKDSPIVTLERVNLEGVDLTGLNLSNTSFEATSLAHAELPEANLEGANFMDADLFDANLTGANLEGANFTGADLFDANLTGANLKGAVFTDARLAEATVTVEQLHTAHSLENALMPDGQVYEDWLKDHPVPPPDTDNDGATRQNGTGQFPQNDSRQFTPSRPQE